MNQPPSTRNNTLLEKAGKVDALIIEAFQKLEKGEVMELTELNIRVKELCDTLSRTPPKDPKNAATHLETVVQSIERLEKKLMALGPFQESVHGC